MHDFIQHLSFNSQAPFAPARPVVGRLTPATAEALLSVMRSYDEVPFTAFRPSPHRKALKSRIVNRKSKILS